MTFLGAFRSVGIAIIFAIETSATTEVRLHVNNVAGCDGDILTLNNALFNSALPAVDITNRVQNIAKSASTLFHILIVNLVIIRES